MNSFYKKKMFTITMTFVLQNGCIIVDKQKQKRPQIRQRERDL